MTRPPVQAPRGHGDAGHEIPSAGADPTVTESLLAAVQQAVLAPSSHNTQPWLFKLYGDGVELHADRTRALPVVDPEDRELTISCGAALLHLRLALRHFGHTPAVTTFPNPADPDLLARVELTEPAAVTGEEEMLVRAISLRHTNRAAFEDRPVPEHVVVALQAAAHGEGAWLHMVHGEERRHAVADLIAEGDREQWADVRFRRELASWIHPRRRHDGLGGYALGIAPLVIRTFDRGDGVAAKDRQLAEGSPVLAVIETETDSPDDWLRAGQALAHVLLRARADEVWASFLNQPIEVLRLRSRLRQVVGGPNLPQLLLRLGYGPEANATPRRPVSEVLLAP